MPGRYALIVATDEYQDPKLSRLRTPALDAEALAEVLRDPEIGDFEVELSTNESDSTLPRRIAAFFSDRRRDELLLLHFSCHGLKDESGQLYFAATDTETAQLDASAIPAEFVSRQMARSRSSNIVMLLDCCYSGAIARGLSFRAGQAVDVDDHLGGRGRVIITASSAMEYAFEGDELTGSGQPSVFTSAIVKALATGEADRDQDHRISVRELYDYVCDEVREITPHQTPNMLSHLEGDLYVARSRYVAPVEPVTVPSAIDAALDSPLAAVRLAAVHELGGMLLGRDPGLADSARRRLAEVIETDDSRTVVAEARAAIAGAEPELEVPEPPPPEPEPEPEPEPPPEPEPEPPPEPEPEPEPEPPPEPQPPPQPEPAPAGARPPPRVPPPRPAPGLRRRPRRGLIAVGVACVAAVAVAVPVALGMLSGDPGGGGTPTPTATPAADKPKTARQRLTAYLPNDLKYSCDDDPDNFFKRAKVSLVCKGLVSDEYDYSIYTSNSALKKDYDYYAKPINPDLERKVDGSCKNVKHAQDYFVGKWSAGGRSGSVKCDAGNILWTDATEKVLMHLAYYRGQDYSTSDAYDPTKLLRLWNAVR